MPLLPAVRRATLGTLAATGRRTISPTHGWGKQSAWLAASGSRRSFRAEARTHCIVREKKSKARAWQGRERDPAVRCPCEAACEALGRRTTVYQQASA